MLNRWLFIAFLSWALCAAIASEAVLAAPAGAKRFQLPGMHGLSLELPPEARPIESPVRGVLSAHEAAKGLRIVVLNPVLRPGIPLETLIQKTMAQVVGQEVKLLPWEASDRIAGFRTVAFQNSPEGKGLAAFKKQGGFVYPVFFFTPAREFSGARRAMEAVLASWQQVPLVKRLEFASVEARASSVKLEAPLRWRVRHRPDPENLLEIRSPEGVRFAVSVPTPTNGKDLEAFGADVVERLSKGVDRSGIATRKAQVANREALLIECKRPAIRGVAMKLRTYLIPAGRLVFGVHLAWPEESAEELEPVLDKMVASLSVPEDAIKDILSRRAAERRGDTRGDAGDPR